jgi:hypothetical protein
VREITGEGEDTALPLAGDAGAGAWLRVMESRAAAFRLAALLQAA